MKPFAYKNQNIETECKFKVCMDNINQKMSLFY